MNAQEEDELALTLFGYPPKRSVVCPSCQLRAEGYYGSFCWLCVQSGAAASLLGHPTTSESQRDRWSGLSAEIRDGMIPAEPAMFDGEG